MASDRRILHRITGMQWASDTRILLLEGITGMNRASDTRILLLAWDNRNEQGFRHTYTAVSMG